MRSPILTLIRYSSVRACAGLAGLLLCWGMLSQPQSPVRAQAVKEADTALVLAVDVSDSVDATRYALQMEGIAQALEDDRVVNTITSGAQGRILISLVQWADQAEIALPWQIIETADDARRIAALIRTLPQKAGEFTCVARTMRYVRDQVLSELPMMTVRAVIDVSGDGIDNCQDPSESIAVRDQLANAGIVINGLPIIVEGENEVVGSGAYRAPGYGLRALPRGPATSSTTLDAWYRKHVIGGPGAFLIVAHGFEDFGRAFRQKFITEVSGTDEIQHGNGTVLRLTRSFAGGGTQIATQDRR